jgi:hypothetical protein
LLLHEDFEFEFTAECVRVRVAYGLILCPQSVDRLEYSICACIPRVGLSGYSVKARLAVMSRVDACNSFPIFGL